MLIKSLCNSYVKMKDGNTINMIMNASVSKFPFNMGKND